MSNPNNDNQCNHWLKELRDFYNEADIKRLSQTLMDVYMHSDYANCKESRSKMYFFIKKIRNIPINQ